MRCVHVAVQTQELGSGGAGLRPVPVDACRRDPVGQTRVTPPPAPGRARPAAPHRGASPQLLAREWRLYGETSAGGRSPGRPMGAVTAGVAFGLPSRSQPRHRRLGPWRSRVGRNPAAREECASVDRTVMSMKPKEVRKLARVVTTVEAVRERFSALRQPLAFFDGPGGTRVPTRSSRRSPGTCASRMRTSARRTGRRSAPTRSSRSHARRPPSS
jgi:hypothetical protein